MKKSKLVLKIGAGMLAFALIGILAWIAMSFLGNPVSILLASHDIHAYVQKTYSDQNLEVGQVGYNFKIGTYSAAVTSPESPDTVFSVFWKSGRLSDNYQFEVAEKNSTLRRLSAEYRAAVEAALEADFPYEMELYYGDLMAEAADISGLELDMPFSLDAIPGGHVVVWIIDPNPTWEALAQALKAAEGCMERAGIPVSTYSLSLRLPKGKKGEYMGDGLEAHRLPAEKLKEENLPQVLERYAEEREQAWQNQKEK